MSATVEYRCNRASEAEIAEHLSRCDAYFVPPLSERTGIDDYASKIVSKAVRFEAWAGDALVGLVAAYCNDHEKRIAYITNVSVVSEWKGRGIAACLVSRCVEHANSVGMRQVSLRVAVANARAIELYEQSGFTADDEGASFVTMRLNLTGGEEHEKQT